MLSLKNWLLLRQAKTLLKETHSSRNKPHSTLKDMLEHLDPQPPKCITCAHYHGCLRVELFTSDVPCYTLDASYKYRRVKHCRPGFKRNMALLEFDETEQTQPASKQHRFIRIAKYIANLPIPR